MTLTIYCLNGPNLNLLGTREPAIYGKGTLEDLKALSEQAAAGVKAQLVFRQSNQEGDLVDWVQEARTKASAVVINAGGYTHTSVALHDALKVLTIPVVEVHLSNPGIREEFRHKSLVSPAASGLIAGFGAYGYRLAIEAAAQLAEQRSN
ncbi:MAG: type II 3-dehydroquinate dehydratase [Alphaproteobacteria bacterium]|nr:type II 3-dehydroquinate dehydratase [Alphaproteobacteria bacterium]